MPLTSKLKKETLSPWLYEEIKFMQLLQPRRELIMLSEGIEKAITDCKIAYDITDGVSEFPFLESKALAVLNKSLLLD